MTANRATVFHLHLNTPHVEEAAERLARMGVGLKRRFGSVRGEGRSLAPGAEAPEGFRFKLQVHQRGRINVTLAPGRRPHFDHLGLVVEEAQTVLGRAESLGWSVRRNERRTFALTPWGFRVEVHPPGSDTVVNLGDLDECHFEAVLLRVADVDAVRSGLDDVFGEIPELEVRSGEEPWVESFEMATGRTTNEVDVRELLGR